MTVNDLIYRAARPFGGLQIAKYLSRRHPRILMYHRIGPGGASGAIDAKRFRRQMQLIKRELNPISLNTLINAHAENNIPQNAIVVTFDDGYSDFYRYAFPILKEENIPCTLFVTTGFINGDIWLWPDRLRYCIDTSTRDAISIPGQHTKYSLQDNRRQIWNDLADHCLTLSNLEKAEFIDSVEKELAVEPPAFPPKAYEALNWDQVREISDAGIEIGSHSVSHPVMTSLSDDALRYELVQSKAAIEERVGCTVTSFCYPNGQPFDFDERVKSAVDSAGYCVALAAFPGRDTLGDRLAVNRYSGCLSDGMFEKTVFGLSYLGLPRNADV